MVFAPMKAVLVLRPVFHQLLFLTMSTHVLCLGVSAYDKLKTQFIVLFNCLYQVF